VVTEIAFDEGSHASVNEISQPALVVKGLDVVLESLLFLISSAKQIQMELQRWWCMDFERLFRQKERRGH